MSSVLTAPAIMVGIGLFFGTILAIAQRFLKVDEDPRIEATNALLPGTNCGACDACGRCAADAAPGLITMKDNLPVIDYSSGGEPRPEAVFRCPTRAIVWLEREQFQDQESRKAGAA